MSKRGSMDLKKRILYHEREERNARQNAKEPWVIKAGWVGGLLAKEMKAKARKQRLITRAKARVNTGTEPLLKSTLRKLGFL
jgi:hypothetical protein